MYASRLVQLLLLALAVCYAADAAWWNVGPRAMRARQLGDIIGGGSSDDDSASDTPTEGAPQTSPTSADPEPTTADPGESPSESVSEPTTEPGNPPSDPSETSTTTTSTSTTSRAQQTSSTTTRNNDPAETTTTSSRPDETTAKDGETTTTFTPVVSTSIDVITKTNDDGSIDKSTSVTLHTSTPGLNEESNETSGMSDQTRDTVIGVVVGVGGAIILGALALVAWRIRSRRKRVEESDGLMDYNENMADKPDAPPGSAPSTTNTQRTPFQSTLENYHQPTQVNASSNF